MRWVACMVVTFTVFFAVAGFSCIHTTSKIRKKAGRLRLMYEANPMSMLIEQAGGASTTGRVRIFRHRTN